MDVVVCDLVAENAEQRVKTVVAQFVTAVEKQKQRKTSMRAAAASDTAATVTFAVAKAAFTPEIITASSTIIAAPASATTAIIKVLTHPKNILKLIPFLLAGASLPDVVRTFPCRGGLRQRSSPSPSESWFSAR